jgi:uncharacterized protein
MKRIHFKVYKDKKSEFRWRLVSKNGKTLADSGEGYKRKSACLKAIEKVQNQAAYAEVI